MQRRWKTLTPILFRGARALTLRLLLALAVAGGAAACSALPRSGPLATQIDPPSENGELDGLVVGLTAEIAALASLPPPPGFPAAFLEAGPIDADALGVGDVVEITIWEGPDGGLFSGGAGGAVTLPPLQVEEGGAVVVPFAGAIPAAGRSLADLRRGVRGALAPLTLAPEVSVRLLEPMSRRLTIQGAVGAPGVLTIEPGLARLTPALAQVGGVTGSPDQIEVVVRRGSQSGSERLSRIYADPARDIALRPRDVVVLRPSVARFSVLGATSRQTELPFPSDPLDLLAALGAAQGLRDLDADPSAVFLFRRERPEIADAVLPGPRPEGLPEGPGRPIVYRLDLSTPEAFFTARSFTMRDGDAIFVSNAPLSELRKFLQLFTAVLTPVQQSSTIAP